MKKGFTEFKITGSGREKLLSYLISRSVALWDIDSGVDGAIGGGEYISAKCSPLMYDTVKTAAGLFEYAQVSVSKRRGAFFRLSEIIFARPGIAVGLLVFALITAVFQNIILDINIVGTYDPETLTEAKIPLEKQERILRELSAYGVKKGTPAHFHRDKAETYILYKLPSLSWVNIERAGARITMRVNDVIDSGEDSSGGTQSASGAPAANVTAARSGVITEMEVYRGRPLYKVGDGVAENSVLVTGIMDGFTSKDPPAGLPSHTNADVSNDKIVYTRAQAKITAVCEVSETFRMPYVSERVLHGSDTMRRTELDTAAGSFKIGFFGGERLPENMSVMVSQSVKRPDIFGFPMPFTLTEKKFTSSSIIKTVGSPEDVLRELTEVIERYKTEILTNPDRETQVLSDSVTCIPDNDGVTAHVTFTIKENIAETQNITINP